MGFGAQKLSRPTVLIGLSWFLVILYNAPILKFSPAIFCNFHLGPKLWHHKWRNFRFCKSCRRAMRFTPLDSSDDFMGRGGLRFSLSLIVSELWRPSSSWSWIRQLPPPHHNRFMAPFPGPPGWAGARRDSTARLILARVPEENLWAWVGRPSCHPTNKKHWRKLEARTPVCGLTLSFLRPLLNYRGNGRYSLTPVRLLQPCIFSYLNADFSKLYHLPASILSAADQQKIYNLLETIDVHANQTAVLTNTNL